MGLSTPPASICDWEFVTSSFPFAAHFMDSALCFELSCFPLSLPEVPARECLRSRIYQKAGCDDGKLLALDRTLHYSVEEPIRRFGWFMAS